MRMTGAQAIIKALELENVNVIFGYPGAAICPFYDALLDSDIKHILTRQEQGAAHAASGYARITGKTGVCVATSGPGATNLITGIATAYMDSIPIVAITGQVATDLIGRDVFQEVDITGATAPFCKHSYLVKKVKDLPRVIKEAFHIASTGRPGPVIIDIPVDIQTHELNFEYPKDVDIRGYKPTYKGHTVQLKKIAEAVKKANCPVICAGGGVINARATAELLEFSKKCNIPVVTTLMGIGSVPTDYELNMGMLGSHGSKVANYLVNKSDLLILMGARVGDRSMGAPSKIALKAHVVHIDIDPAEIGKNLEAKIPVVGDVKVVLNDLLEIVVKGDTDEWVKTVKMQKAQNLSDVSVRDKCNNVNPKYLLSMLSDVAGDDLVVTTEVGQNQIWTANNLKVKKAGTFITSGGMGTMGYGLPSSIGVKLGSPNSKVVVVAGDGSFQMSMQELGTIKQNKLGVKIIIFNNQRLGMVRELQKLRYEGRYSQVFLQDNPDFVKLFESYGFKGESINTDNEVFDALQRMFRDDEPYLLECIVDSEESTL